MANFFERLLSKKPPRMLAPMRDVAALIEPLRLPAVHLTLSQDRSRSHFGGVPNLPPELAWPQRKGRRLGFLARLSLADLQQVQAIDWLPTTGALLFFYDLDEQPWGYDPKDRGGAVVMHVTDLDEPPVVQDRDDEGKTVAIPHRWCSFRNAWTSPPVDRDAIGALQLTDEELHALSDVEQAEFQGLPKHQVGGYPSPVQGSDMDLECQLVTHGLYCGNSSGYEDSQAAELSRGGEGLATAPAIRFR